MTEYHFTKSAIPPRLPLPASQSCQRCPIGSEKRAKQWLRISLEDTFWTIYLCDQHAADLENAIFGWGRLGEQHLLGDEKGRGLSLMREADRRAAEQRATQVAQDRRGQPKWYREYGEDEEELERVVDRQPKVGDQMVIPTLGE